jgi:hypothetical protein
MPPLSLPLNFFPNEEIDLHMCGDQYVILYYRYLSDEFCLFVFSICLNRKHSSCMCVCVRAPSCL